MTFGTSCAGTWGSPSKTHTFKKEEIAMRLALPHAVALFTLLVAATPAFAADPATERRAAEIVELRNRTPEQAQAVVARLSDKDIGTLIREQGKIDDLLAVTPDPEAMTPEDRELLSNSTKVIDSLIADDRRVADERLICQQERRIGSRLASRNCRTQAELDAARNRGKQDVERAQVKGL